MISRTVFSHLKNTDLHCISALEAIRDLLGVELVGLKRLLFWEFKLSASSDQEADRCLQTVLNTTYYVINPNKESFSLEKLPRFPLLASASCFLVQGYSKTASHQAVLAEKIRRKCGVEIRELRKSVLWLIGTDKNKDVTQQELIDRVIVSRSREQGILINPVYETFRFLTPADYL